MFEVRGHASVTAATNHGVATGLMVGDGEVRAVDRSDTITLVLLLSWAEGAGITRLCGLNGCRVCSVSRVSSCCMGT